MADPGEELDIQSLDDVRMIRSDVLPCYDHLGVTEQDIQEFKRKGQYYDRHRLNVILYNFYGKNNFTREHTDNGQKKDEL